MRVGVFGYAGKERGGNGLTNQTTYVGPDFVVDAGDKVQIGLEYLERRDDDPFFEGAGSAEVKTRGGFVEINVFPKGQDGRWALSILYNNVDSDDPAARSEAASLTLNWLMARNLRLLAEGRRDLENDRTIASIGLVTAF